MDPDAHTGRKNTVQRGEQRRDDVSTYTGTPKIATTTRSRGRGMGWNFSQCLIWAIWLVEWYIHIFLCKPQSVGVGYSSPKSEYTCALGVTDIYFSGAVETLYCVMLSPWVCFSNFVFNFC